MINLFSNYLKEGKAKRKTADPEEAKALLSQSRDRLDYVEAKEVDDKTAKFVLEDAYEAAREAAQALMSIKGFKPYSHEATISFIKEFYKASFEEDRIYQFDHFRQLRNNSVYKAEIVTKNDAAQSLLFAKQFIEIVKKLVETEKLG